MWTLLLLAAIGTTPPTTEVHTLSGETLTGPIVGLSGNQVTIETAEGRVAIDLDRLAGLASQDQEAGQGPQPGLLVELADSSAVAAADFTVHEGRARIQVGGAEHLELPVEEVVAVRLQPESAATADAWAKIRQQDKTTDLLVVRKGDVLDYHRGTIRDIDDAIVKFQLEGEVLAVKRAKVFGLVYYHPRGRELPDSLCQLVDISGSAWSVRSLALEGDTLRWTTLLGLEVSRPLASVARIDFSQGKIVHLSDLEPEAVRWTPYLGTVQQLAVRSDLYAPRKDTNLRGGPLELGGKIYGKGLALHSRTELIYRLPSGFGRFKATVGIDDGVRPRGNVLLVVRGDDRVLAELILTGVDPPKPLDLDISGVRRLVLLVDFGDDLDVADHLDLCDARIVK